MDEQKSLKGGGSVWFLCPLFNAASYAAPLTSLCWRMLGSNKKLTHLAILVVVLPEVAVSALARHIEGGEPDIPV
jgi:hypothetical protein